MTPQAEQILQGNRRAIARQISWLENNQPQAIDVLAELYPHTGRAYLIGITGPPGTGKSTLVNSIVKLYRRGAKTVAVLSIDPTSPFTGGALLGDRIRLTDLAGDPGVFVRSMATRGSLGGLARAAADATRVFDAAGYDIVIIETVGVGQAEVEIAGLAHSVVVVEVPGLGDEVQAFKAGLLEIADIFVVNKADREGADRTEAALALMLELAEGAPPRPTLHHGILMELLPQNGAAPATDRWRPPICQTVATTGQGVERVVEALAQHRAFQEAHKVLEQRDRSRLLFELQHLLQEHLLASLLNQLAPAQLNQILDQVTARQLDPHTAASLLIEEVQR